MHRRSTLAAVALALLANLVAAQDGVRQGTIKTVDPEKRSVTITADGREEAFAITDRTKVMVAGKVVREPFKDTAITAGAEVSFKAAGRNGQRTLVGLRVDAGRVTAKRDAPPAKDTAHLKPLVDLGSGEYQGFQGGLYPGGGNSRPPEHEAAGLALAGQVRPLDADGKPSPSGKIVLLSIGMSNTVQSSMGFQRAMAGDQEINPHLVFVNGAQGGQTASKTQDANDNDTGGRYWAQVDAKLKAAGVTRAQVQAVWVKQADARPTETFPKHAQKLEAELANIARVLKDRFPNLKLTYWSGRTYGGYAKTPLNPEPFAYETGFAVKWLIERQLKGDSALNFNPAKGVAKSPWLSWGPYLWANGTTPQSDGLTYEARDFSDTDGTHQSPSGQAKVGKQLLQFFKTDSTTKGWFLGARASGD